ncbi:MAG: Hsp70 family protein, partial [Gluconobacter oxydans]
NASADKAKRELVELRNSTESLIHQTEKSITEGGDKVPAADKSEAEAAIAEAREALGGENLDTLKAASEKLTQAAMKVGQAVYQAGQGAEGGAAPEGEKKDENVVDADFEDLEDDSKKH